MALPRQYDALEHSPTLVVLPAENAGRKGTLRFISPRPEDKLFTSLLEDQQVNGRSLAVSVGVHVVAVVFLIVLPFLVTEQLGKYTPRAFVELVAPPPIAKPAPPPVEIKMPPPPPPRPAPRIVEPPKPKIELPPPPPERIPEVKKPPVLPPQPTKVKPPEPKFEDALRPGPVAPPKPSVKTNVFSEGSSAKPTLNLPPRQVQTGGFGDPNGATGDPIPGKQGNIARLGSFDLPAGPGYGNGTGGAHGARGTVASAGFGNGIASAAGEGGTGGRRGTVQQGSFGDSQPVAEAPRAARPKPVQSPTTPIGIISKPRPIYTEEARRLKLEGEVLLDVLFGASGELRVMNVTQGLGHGLDEAAMRAAEQIKYKPARRDGQPVDYRATVHIVFQLAY